MVRNGSFRESQSIVLFEGDNWKVIRSGKPVNVVLQMDWKLIIFQKLGKIHLSKGTKSSALSLDDSHFMQH